MGRDGADGELGRFQTAAEKPALTVCAELGRVEACPGGSSPWSARGTAAIRGCRSHLVKECLCRHLTSTWRDISDIPEVESCGGRGARQTGDIAALAEALAARC